MKKGIYLANTPLDEAIGRWRGRIRAEAPGPLAGEWIPAAECSGRVTSNPVFARLSSPSYHSAAMDGFAVTASATFSASETAPLILAVGAGAFPVDTGDPLPENCDAVIMKEDASRLVVQDKHGETQVIEIIGPATPWQHVRVIGEDIVSTELILPENHLIRPVDVAALLSSGHLKVAVRRRPKVVIIPTGSELIEPGRDPVRGEIVEFNSAMLSAMVCEWGGEPLRKAPIPDRPDLLKAAVLSACEEGDLVVVNAGSSAGTEDFTAAVISDVGEVMIHGVSIKPGKPVILGWARGKPVVGLPGYPVATFLTFRLFCREIVYLLQGLEAPQPEYLEAMLSRQVASPLGQEEFIRVKLGRVGGRVIATPVSRGAGLIMSLVRADGVVRIPAMSEGFGAGVGVQVEILRTKDEIDRTVVCIGSHDNALDLLAQALKKKHPSYSLSSAHVGSMGGLVALTKGETHCAGTHLLDGETGEYNVPFIRKMFPDRRVLLVNLVYRVQGFIVAAGNPKAIRTVADLAREDVVFINRQNGSGTRLLTDKCLKEAGIPASSIRGYAREEYTHMGVASAVLTGVADAGMGILAAAHALGLEFVPVASERYDLVVPESFRDFPPLAAMLDIIREDREFRESVMRLGGYDVTDMGKVFYEA